MSTQERISQLLIYWIKQLHRINSKCFGNIHNPNPKNFEDLTPQYQLEVGNTYSDALSWAVRNPEVKNLALTGPYGSGKSSILKTFEADHPEYTYLNISLASFEDDIQNGIDVRKRIEISILQQIFYKVSVRKVPFSRFRRIRNTPAWRFILSATLMIIWVLSGVFIFKPEFYDRLSWWNRFMTTYGDITLYVAIILFITGAILFLTKLLKTYNSAQFKKLNVSNGELELAQEADTSILNKHLDEILYFFEETAYDVVIIEDLDRFEDPEIFTKLRELNNLINSSSQVKRQVTFIYALKDDVFKDNNRTKFFDFLIPVIPVINSSNSGEKLLKKFVDSNTKGLLTDTFISDITLFIEDMRMLKNIYNEYILYKEKIGLKVNEEKLLGIIVYKNFYPSDFAALNINQGLVYQCFQNKAEVIKSVKIKNEQEIAESISQINALESELLANIGELQSVYTMAMINMSPTAYKYRLNSNTYENNELLGEAFFQDFQVSTTIQHVKAGYGSWSNANFTFKKIEKEVNAKLSYVQREAIINAKNEGELNKAKARIELLKEENAKISGWSLQELINKQSISALYKDAAKEKLLIYLLRRGYIDEMYHTYISFFYEGTITRTDMDFVIAVKNLEALEFDFGLVKIDQILKKISINEFQQSELLNYDLLDYLVQNAQTYKREFYAIINQLSNQTAVSNKFLSGYLINGKMINVVFKTLCKEWADVWNHISKASSYSPETVTTFLITILRYADLVDIIKIDSKKVLSSYINNRSDFLALFEKQDYPKIKDVLKSLDVEFIDLDYVEESKEMFEFVYKNSCYDINAGMIEKIIRLYGKHDDNLSENLLSKHLTTINYSGCQPLINYINENLDIYVEGVMLALEDNYAEETDILAPVFNSNLKVNIKEAILKQGTEVFKSIEELPQELWNYALQVDSIMPDWENVVAYFQSEVKDENVLTTWLQWSDNAEMLSDDEMGDPDGQDKDTLKTLCEFLLLNNNLSDEHYEKLIGKVLWLYNALEFQNLSKNKIEILLKKRTLGFTKYNYDLLKKHFNGLNITLLTQNFNAYLTNALDYVFDNLDYVNLLKSNFITPQQKISLITEMDASIINNHVLSNFISQILITSPAQVTFDILNKLIIYNSEQTTKLKLLIMNFSSLTNERRFDMLNLIGKPYDQITLKGKRPSFPFNEDNLNLTKRLAVYDLIASYKIDKNKITINNKRK